MIGIQLAGKKNRIPATAFVRALSSFLDLLKDVDSVVSKQTRGSVRWEIATLQKNSPAVAELVGVSRLPEMDYSAAVLESVLDGLEQLTERPEVPQFYSFSALRRVREMAQQSKQLKWLSVYSGNRRTMLTENVSHNVEYLIASGSKSLGSFRGSLDAIIVHSGHEFRVWSPKWTRPVTCSFDKSLLPQVTAHLGQQVEVIGELHRNSKGEPVLMKVHEFVALEPAAAEPSIDEMCGLVSGLYDPGSLKTYLDELRNG
jgi:hypothetical protein